MQAEQALRWLQSQLVPLYDGREARRIAALVLEQITGITPGTAPAAVLDAQQVQTLQDFAARLKTGEPVQHVLQQAWFYRYPFFVNEAVLIPRPETEELVEWIVRELPAPQCRVLDVGTGSGCIAITLKKEVPALRVTGLDVSAAALEVARRNARALHAEVEWLQGDILSDPLLVAGAPFDIVVSNPPYIRPSEADAMHTNVLAFEPHLALFTPEEDALLFYRRLCEQAATLLSKGGRLYVEINEAMGEEVKRLMEGSGFTEVALRQDLQGRDRMVRAVW